eukprot:12892468-Prorocentrum_lima.AAC.1
MTLCAMLEPRTVLRVVKDTMKTVASDYDILKKTMIDELSEPALRIPQKIEYVASFVRLMLGEEGLRTE